MSIQVTRLPRNRGNFERIANEVTRDRNLSIAALGLLVRLLTDGENFDSIEDIADRYSRPGDIGRRERGRGRDAYLKAARELQEAGLIERVKTTERVGHRIRSSVFAIPQVGPETVQASLGRPAESGNAAVQPTTGSGVAGMSSGKKPSVQVASETPEPVVGPPAETDNVAGGPRNASGGPSPMQTINRPTDLPPPDLATAAVTLELGGGGRDDVELHPDVDGVIAGLWFNRIPTRRQHRALTAAVNRVLTVDGLTAKDANEHLEIRPEDRAAVSDAYGVYMHRLKPDELPSPLVSGESAALTNVYADRCGQCSPVDRTCETADGRIYPCPECSHTYIALVLALPVLPKDGPYRDTWDPLAYEERDADAAKVYRRFNEARTDLTPHQRGMVIAESRCYAVDGKRRDLHSVMRGAA